jgi:hypothetical protein
MSHVDTSIGFSLRSEPPRVATSLDGIQVDLAVYSKTWLSTHLKAVLPFSVGIAVANPIVDPIFKGWKGWQDFGRDLLAAPIIAAAGAGTYYLLCLAGQDRLRRKIVKVGFDSPVVQLTAEGQWITFRFDSGREFVDRWDRLLRFKIGDEFTEFEFPAKPPLIIPTQSIPEETRATIAQFCAIEKIPSETKR